MRGAWSWLRDHPWEADLALAALVFLVSWDQAMADKLIRVVSLALAATLVPRRKYPVQAFAAAAMIGLLQVFLGLQPHGSYVIAAFQPTATDITLAILLYTLAAHTPRRTSVLGLVACFVLSAIAIARWGPAHSPNPAFSVLAAAALLGSVSLSAWVLGDSVAYRYRVAYYAALEDRAARLEAERDAQARIASAAERARELQERRARAIDESAARLRRIERDLHDGAQVRLAALALTLGEIKEALDSVGQDRLRGGGADQDRAAEDEARTRMLIEAAHRNAKETLVELRDLARGIHPAVLDRGLDAALSALAETSAAPVGLTVRITRRPSPAIEAIAYFCAAELLANVVKHGQASKATVVVTEQDGELVMTVTDDGRGGARISPGGGLDGLRERVQTVDGRLAISSPAGGPTTVTIALPGHA